MQVQNLLLETKYNNKWEGTREIVCLVKIEARQRCIPKEKGCGHPPAVRRSAVKRRLGRLYRSVLPGLCLPLANLLGFVFFPHT